MPLGNKALKKRQQVNPIFSSHFFCSLKIEVKSNASSLRVRVRTFGLCALQETIRSYLVDIDPRFCLFIPSSAQLDAYMFILSVEC
jgi:hypothetical protein